MSKDDKKKTGFMSGAPSGVGGVSAAPPAVDATNSDVLAPKGRIRPRMGGSSMVPDAMPGRAPESAVAAPTYNAFTTGMRSGRFDTPPDVMPQQRGHLNRANNVERTEYSPMHTREVQTSTPDVKPKQVGHLNDAALVEEGVYDPQHSREVQTSYPDVMPQQARHDKRSGAVEEMRPEAEAPVFEKDDSRRDGGFFKWLGSLTKKRPGKREGESDDDYDERMTRNNMRIATLADAIRHMGNIYNTSKGAVPQKFNSSAAEMQAGLDKRKAERAKKAAAEADAAYKNANLQIKMDAADADRAYKGQMLELKRSADKRADQNAKDLNEYRKGILGVQQGNLKLAGERLGETKRHNQATERLSASRLALAQSRAARGGSGSGAKGSGGANGGYGYATPYGRLTSKKQLTPQQEAQAWNEMRNLGMITPQKQRELDRAMNGYEGSDGKMVSPSSDRARQIIQGAISYGLLDASSRGESLRKTFRDGFGYADIRTSDKAKRGVNTSGRKVGYVTKRVSKSEAKQIRGQRKGANPIRWQGSGSKPKAQAKGGTSTGKGTDWSQYVK